jgi:hypothetical protein
MSMVDDYGLSPEEQAQFDSMRDQVSPGSNASSPDQLVQPDAAQSGDVTPPVDKAAQVEPAAQGEVQLAGDEDPEVETIKDASGKDVIDAKTGKPQRRVSFHKFQRTLNELTDLKKQFQTTAEERARIDERLKIINEALTTPAPGPQQTEQDEDPEPNPDDNIFEYVKWQKREMERRTQTFQSFVDQVRTDRDEADMASAYRRDANQFAGTEPHFGQAYNFLMTNRAAQLRAGGWDDEKKIQDQVVKEEKGLVRNALKAGTSPAKRIFDMTKAAGFVPQEVLPPQPGAKPTASARPPAQAVPGTPLNGAAPQVPAVTNGAARPSGVPSVTEQVALAQQGAEASKTLSCGGGAPMEPLTAQKLLTMDEDEFAAVVDNLSKTKLRELFGD